MSVGRLASYLILIMLLVMVVVGGGGMLLPTVFNLNTDLMFVLLPLTMGMLIMCAYVLGRKLGRMVVSDIRKLGAK
jgi:hypothetical protein